MPSGTTLNGVFAARIHKSNAVDVKEAAESALQGARERLLMLSVLTPASDPEGVYGLLTEVGEAIEEIRLATLDAFFANYIIDYPDEVEDELEEGGS